MTPDELPDLNAALDALASEIHTLIWRDLPDEFVGHLFDSAIQDAAVWSTLRHNGYVVDTSWSASDLYDHLRRDRARARFEAATAVVEEPYMDTTLDQALEALGAGVDDILWNRLPEKHVRKIRRTPAIWESVRVRVHAMNVSDIGIVWPTDPQEETWSYHAAKAHALAQGWRLERPALADMACYRSHCYLIDNPERRPRQDRLIVWQELRKSGRTSNE